MPFAKFLTFLAKFLTFLAKFLTFLAKFLTFKFFNYLINQYFLAFPQGEH